MASRTPQIEPHRRVFVCGRTQSGKSYWIKSQIRRLDNLVIYDLKREYAAFGVVVRSIEEMRRAFSMGASRVVFQPPNSEERYFSDFCKFVFENLRNIVVVVDEVQTWTGSGYIPQSFKDILCVLEAEGVGVIAATQRPSNTHYDVRSNRSYYVVFSLETRNDAKMVESDTDISARDVQGLEAREHIIKSSMWNPSIRKFRPLGS